MGATITSIAKISSMTVRIMSLGTLGWIATSNRTFLCCYAEYCYAEYCYAEYRYAEYCYAEYYYAECCYAEQA